MTWVFRRRTSCWKQLWRSKYRLHTRKQRDIKHKTIRNHDRCTASVLEHAGSEMAAIGTASRTHHTLTVTTLEPSGWCAEAGVPGVLCSPTALSPTSQTQVSRQSVRHTAKYNMYSFLFSSVSHCYPPFLSSVLCFRRLSTSSYVKPRLSGCTPALASHPPPRANTLPRPANSRPTFIAAQHPPQSSAQSREDTAAPDRPRQ